MGLREGQESRKSLRLLIWGTEWPATGTAVPKQEQILEGSCNVPAECLFGLAHPEF